MSNAPAITSHEARLIAEMMARDWWGVGPAEGDVLSKDMMEVDGTRMFFLKSGSPEMTRTFS